MEKIWWGEVGSNHRRRMPTDLQSVPFGRSGISPANLSFHPPERGKKYNMDFSLTVNPKNIIIHNHQD